MPCKAYSVENFGGGKCASEYVGDGSGSSSPWRSQVPSDAIPGCCSLDRCSRFSSLSATCATRECSLLGAVIMVTDSRHIYTHVQVRPHLVHVGRHVRLLDSICELGKLILVLAAVAAATAAPRPGPCQE